MGMTPIHLHNRFSQESLYHVATGLSRYEGRKSRANAKSPNMIGWQRQAESSELGDGGFPVRRTIAKAFGLDAATRSFLSLPPLRDSAIALPAEEKILERAAPSRYTPFSIRRP